MAPPKKPKSRGERKRAQIRRGAYKCFRATGYADTSVDVICRKVGISKGSFYWHYDSKQHVFIDILEVWSREVMDELYEQFEEAVVTDDYLKAITFALENELHRGRALAPLWMEFNAWASRDRELQAALSKFYRRARTAIAEILRPVMEDRFNDEALQSVSSVIFGAYLGLLMQEQPDTSRANAAETVKLFMSVVGEVFSRLPQEFGRPQGRKEGARSTRSRPPAFPRLSDDELSDFLSAHPKASQQLTLRVREELLQQCPQLSERHVVGWKVLTYRLNGDVFSLKPVDGGARLSFHNGADLADPENRLLGDGKQRRHVIISAPTELDAAITHLIRDASDAYAL